MVLAPDGLFQVPTSISQPRAGIFAKPRILEKKEATEWPPFGGQDLKASSPFFWDGIVLAAENVLPAAATIGIIKPAKDIGPGGESLATALFREILATKDILARLHTVGRFLLSKMFFFEDTPLE